MTVVAGGQAGGAWQAPPAFEYAPPVVTAVLTDLTFPSPNQALTVQAADTRGGQVVQVVGRNFGNFNASGFDARGVGYAVFYGGAVSSNPDDVVQRCCSAAFSFLTVDANTRTRVLEEGGAAAVAKLTLASNQNLVVKHNCVRAICNLAVTQGSEARLVKDGCLPALMNIMTYCPESVDLCLLSLFNMSTVQDRFTRIEEMTEVLMRLQNSLHNHAQEHMYLTVLCNLSAIRGNQLRMVEDGVQRVVDRVRKSHNLELRTIGANIFGNFCTDSRAKAKMVENHAIPTMINMLQVLSKPLSSPYLAPI